MHIGIALRIALVQLANIFHQVVGGPQYLLLALLRDPVRHLQALEQLDKAAEVDAQGQAHHHCRTH